MRVSTSTTAQGTQLVLLDEEHETLRAEVSGDSSAPGVTVYWRGRVHLDQLASFFVESCPPASAPTFAALVFQAHERVEIGGFPDPGTLMSCLPKDPRFVRLEHAERGASLSPDFIVWSRIDLADIPLDEPAPDYIGVSALPGRMKEIATRLASFVDKTHVDAMRPGVALDRVSRLLRSIPG